MIEAQNLTKRFGGKPAVDGVSFAVHPGTVTGFLGPNGAGKSTMMKLALGLQRATAGSITVNGTDYARSAAPLHEVGALLDAGWMHPRRSAYDHLRAIGLTQGYGRRRVSEVLELAGIASVGRAHVGTFSLGMRQRLGIAEAMLGDPAVLLLDEPVNGLDPDGVVWIRELLRELAAEWRTVLLSSHLMSEMQLTADRIIVIGRGRVLADGRLQDVISGGEAASVVVRTPRPAELAAHLQRPGVAVATSGDELQVTGMDVVQLGEVAMRAGIPVHELRTVSRSLEDACRELVGDSIEHSAGARNGVSR